MLNEITSNPLFGVTISIIAFAIASFLFKKTQVAILNSLLVSMILVIVVLLVFDIPLENYQKGGSIIKMMISPVETMVIGVSLYKQFETFKKYVIPVIISVACGGIFVTVLVYFLGRGMNLPNEIVLASIPKSITTAIGIEISTKMGWITSITVMFIVLTGITGGVIAPLIIKLFGIKRDVSQGLAIGTSSHAVGTAKAIEIGEVQGAMSGLALGLNAIITSIWVPFYVVLLNIH